MSLVTIPTMRKPAGVRALVQFIFAGESSLDPRITFSRTSNATITKSDGTIGYAPHNLLTHSEQFDNVAWTTTNLTITANNTTAPNSTQTADLIYPTTTGVITNRRILRSVPSVIGQTNTVSVYVKANNRQWVFLSAPDASSSAYNCYFDLTNGVVGTTGVSVLNPTITNVGNGWYRLSVSSVATTTTNYFYLSIPDANNGTNVTANGTDGIYIWGAQLEISSTATTYNPTTVKNLLGFTEAFDNAAWTKSNSFVQTNLLTYSEDFSNAAWSKTASSITANAISAPNGTITADLLTADGTGSSHQASQNFTFSAIPYTISLYAKAGTNNFIQLRFGAAAGAASCNFDLANGIAQTPATGSSAITQLNNGWYRCQYTVTPTAASSNFGFFIVSSLSSTSSEANTLTTSVYIWGAQLVQGSVAGDYRRTDAAALPVFYPNHNGVVCAEQIQSTAANGTVLESYTATGGSMTFSVWLRRVSGTGNVDITMDTGTTWTTQAITTSWARYSITASPTAGARTAGIRVVTSGDVVQMFGTQVSDSASLDPYVLNAGAAPSLQTYYGPRFDYDPVTKEAKGLLIEEQRSNLLLNSSLAGTSLATQNVTVTAVAHTLSFYGTGTVTLSGTATATVNGTGAYPTRTTLTFTPTAGTLTVTVSGTVQYAQLEIGSFATSFIPTAASAVTRTADVATIAGSNFWSWWNRLEGAMVAQFDSPTSGNRNIIGVDDNTANNRYQLRTEGTDPYFRQRWVNTEQVALDLGTVSANNMSKIAYSYKVDDFGAVFNGGTVQTDTSASTVLVDRLRLGTSQAAEYLNGHIKQMSYYNIALSDAIKKDLTA